MGTIPTIVSGRIENVVFVPSAITAVVPSGGKISYFVKWEEN